MKIPPPSPHACGAFTLLELILVMSVMVLVIGVGVGSFAYFDQVDPLEEPAQQLGQMSKYAMNTAVIQHRGMTIGFDKESFGVLGASSGGMGSYSHGKNIKVFIKRWVAKAGKRPRARSGVSVNRASASLSPCALKKPRAAFVT